MSVVIHWHNIKIMQSIPDAKIVIDLILSKTQRKTPTIVHRAFSIQKIRQFYVRKIKFFEQNVNFLLEKILKNFPLIDQLHPFFSDLLNILFNRNNYKIALNRLHGSKSKISKICQNHLKLLKYANSLYNCKQIKKVAFGKMCKKIKKLQHSLVFLEKTRRQIEKLPKIDPHRKTILLCGSSGVGKSALINKMTRTNSTVKNSKGTTKFLFLGHITNLFLRWQVIDTPGINKTILASLNSIEMQSLIALINLNYRLLYIFDFNSNYYSRSKQQMKILIELRKLIKNKEKIFILGKTDLGWDKYNETRQKAMICFLNSFDRRTSNTMKTSMHDELGILDLIQRGSTLTNRSDKNKKMKILEILERSNGTENQNDLASNLKSHKEKFMVYEKIQTISEFSKVSSKKFFSKGEMIRHINPKKTIEKNDNQIATNIFREEKFREFILEKASAATVMRSFYGKYQNKKAFLVSLNKLQNLNMGIKNTKILR